MFARLVPAVTAFRDELPKALDAYSVDQFVKCAGQRRAWAE
jgi:hypothetical protein